MNNMLVFNNGGYGISMGVTRGVILNNVLSYNNNNYGIGASASDLKVNNIRSYNNAGAGLYGFNATTRYYGNNIFFNNSSMGTLGTTGYLEYPYLGWSTGTLTTT